MPDTNTTKSERVKFLALAGISDFANERMLNAVEELKGILSDIDPHSHTGWKIARLINKMEISRDIFSQHLKENAPTFGAED